MIAIRYRVYTMFIQTRRYFTLIELVTVMAVISILAGLSLVAVQDSKNQAKHVRWQAYNAMLNRYPETVVNFNFIEPPFKNNAGESLLRNAAEGCAMDGFDAKLYNGIVHGATWVPHGGRTKRHNALQFDGRNDYVEVPGQKALNVNADSEPFTILTWIRCDSNKGTQVICSRADWNDSAQYDIYLKSGQVEADVGTRSSRWRSTKIPVDEWAHIALVSDGREYQAFLNGEILTGGKDIKGAKFGEVSAPLLLGAVHRNKQRKIQKFFQGRMDEFVLIRRALDEKSVKQHYQAGLVK